LIVPTCHPRGRRGARRLGLQELGDAVEALPALERLERCGRWIPLPAIAEAEHAREPGTRLAQLASATRHGRRVRAQPLDERAVRLHEGPGFVERFLLRGRELRARIARGLLLDRDEERERQRELATREQRRASDARSAAALRV